MSDNNKPKYACPKCGGEEFVSTPEFLGQVYGHGRRHILAKMREFRRRRHSLRRVRRSDSAGIPKSRPVAANRRGSRGANDLLVV